MTDLNRLSQLKYDILLELYDQAKKMKEQDKGKEDLRYFFNILVNQLCDDLTHLSWIDERFKNE